MTPNSQAETEPLPTQPDGLRPAAGHRPPTAEPDKVLCPHCLRTAKNGIKCQGICVADSEY
jgi:hypothetical protein